MYTVFKLPVGLARTGFVALLGTVLGAALQLQQEALWQGVFYASFVLLALVGYAQAATKNIAKVWPVAGVVLCTALLGFGATGLRAALFAAHALNPALEGRDVLVTGVVTDMPQRSAAGLRFRMAVEAATLDGQVAIVPPRMDVGWYGGVYPTGTELAGLQRQPGEVQAGERWQMTLRLKAPHGNSNPHGFDYELWMWEQGVQASAYVRVGPHDPTPQRLAQTWRHPVALARQTVRERIYTRVKDRQLAGMIAALVVGDQGAIERADWEVFRATGVAHLVSISGLHITMFAWGAALLVGWLWRRSMRLCLALPAPTAALVGGVALAAAYALFSGWGVPAQRTCVMLATVALLRLAGVRWPWPQVWMLACAVVVAFDPWALLQPGFWLSFVAVGVLFATDLGSVREHTLRAAGPPQGARAPLGGSAVHEVTNVGATFMSAAGPPHGARAPLGGSVARAATSVGAMFREQWVITVALTPLTLLLFGQVSVVGLVANALAIPWVTLVITPLAMLGVLLPVVWDGAAGAIGLLLVWLQWLASFPWASVSVAMPPLWAGMAGALGGVVLVFPWSWRMRILGVPLLLPVLLWQAPSPPPGQFELLAADIGQGNAVLVRTAHHALLFDAGPRYSLESDAGHRVLVPLLQALHTRLDRVVLSHRDTDHVGGAPAVLAMQPQADVFSSIEAEHALQALRPAQRCVAGQHWDWDGVAFDVLHPMEKDYASKSKPNALSCTVRISNGTQTALLAGDIEKEQEARLVADGAAIRADVLLVPHHGSKTSSSAAFLDAVQPQIALVQSGYRNRFGHPVSAVLARYTERGIRVVDSPHCGAATWQSSQPEAVQCQRELGLRYWHHHAP
ncbi:MAG: DNA internalization-related competence protein ComEC/Rec2 [Burkholderiales bacterium RIFCSPLOWO2_12_FULL_61_40]|nr:MAG: DNA internalization-related competence protein ComEC/Rec2 [Burkholderiales bacterium RIFCSPLOWO2_12_FULL_61_40]